MKQFICVQTSIFFLVVSVFGLGCSKKQSSSSSINLSFQTKNNSTLNTEIETIILNISAPDLHVQVWQWECEQVSCASLTVEVQAGSSRLIQLLVVTGDASDTTKVNYGDTLTNIEGGDNVVAINVNELASFDNEGSLSGQYIPAAGHPLAGKKLTGDVEMNVYVGVGKPDMKIKKFEIFGGWFKLFLLDAIPFKYLFSGFDSSGNFYLKRPIFNDLHDSEGLDLSSAGIQANGSNIIKYSSALNLFDNRDGVFHQRPFPSRTLGFFGQNTGGKSLCSKTLPGSTVFDGNNTESYLCKSVAGLNCANYFQWSDINKSLAGSHTGAANSCTSSANEYEVRLSHIGDGFEGDGMLPFYGPFITSPVAGQAELIDVDTSTGEVSWTLNSEVYLPRGIEIFTATLAANYNEEQISDHDDGTDCSKLTSLGFVSQGVATGTSGSQNIPMATANSSNLYVVACPIRLSGQYYNTAAVVRPNDSGPNQGPYSLVEFKIYDDSATVVPGFDFNDVNFQNSVPYVTDPVDAMNPISFYVEVRNKENVDIVIDDIHINHSYASAFPVPDHSPAVNPSAAPDCGALTGLTLNPGQICVVKVVFNAPAGSAGYSYHNALSVQAHRSGEAQDYYGAIDFVAPVIYQLDAMTSLHTIELVAPEGEYDFKYIEFYNDGGSNWDVDAYIPADGSTHGNVTFHYVDGPSTCDNILMSGNCHVLLSIHNHAGLISDGDNNTGTIDFSPGAASAMLDLMTYVETPTFDVTNDIHVFPPLTMNASQPITFANNTSIMLDTYGAVMNNGGTNFTITGVGCDNQTGISTSCMFTLNANYTSGFGFDSTWVALEYSLGGSVVKTFRVLGFDAEADHH